MMNNHSIHRPPRPLGRIASSVASISLLALALASGWGCGGKAPQEEPDARPMADAGPDAPPFQSCGDSLVSGDEECDDGNLSEDDECLNDCTLACGDGVVNASESCDTGIGAGMAGACPTACDDGDACTDDVLAGEGCQVQCLTAPVTSGIDDDGCCPPGQDANSDNDCTTVCGNAIVEPGETCDSGIAPGLPGSCPIVSDCVDNAACTTDSIDYEGTCQAACRFDPITQPSNGDGCCPAGADPGNDDDCSAACGDGVHSPQDGETCDTAIPAGQPGACPTAADCDDSQACTLDTLTGAGTCSAACTNAPITQPNGTTSDGCCPPLGNANNDLDCSPLCGNGSVETGETCDDGNTTGGDGCSATCQREPTAYRVNTLQLRDPHAFALILNIACTDITSNLNNELATAITSDGDGDGLLDFSVLTLFRPLDQTAPTTPMEIVFADCTAPQAGTSCSQSTSPAPIPSTATNMSTGTCLAPIPGTVRPYNPGVTSATGPCYSSDAEDITIDLGGIIVALSDARVASTYMGNPATNLVNGLLEGFISEATAEATIIPANIPIVGGDTLASILRGGMGNCASGDDRDTGPDGVTRGWWVYFNFTAVPVPWTSP